METPGRVESCSHNLITYYHGVPYGVRLFLNPNTPFEAVPTCMAFLLYPLCLPEVLLWSSCAEPSIT